MMISISTPFGSVGNLEQTFRDKYAKWIILGASHEATYECYLIESDANELNFGLGVAVAIRGVMPKALFVEKCKALFVGFDSFLAVVSVANPSSIINSRLLQLDGVFVDAVLLRGGNVCVVHELGALVVTTDLSKVWSVSTDIVSEWNVDPERELISLTEADTGSVTRLSTSTGVVLTAPSDKGSE